MGARKRKKASGEEPMPREPWSISPTRLRAYATCPLQYRLRYVEKLPTVYSPASLVGQAVHSALEGYFLEKRRAGREVSSDSAVKAFDDTWSFHLPTGVSSGVEAAAFDSAYESGRRILQLYLEEVAPRGRPHLVEHRFRFSVPGVKVQVVGTADLIDQNGVVIDHKTSLAAYPESYPHRDLQLCCYAIGYATFKAGSRIRPGQLPALFFVPDVRVDVLVRAEIPFVQQLGHSYDREDLEEFVRRTARIVAGIEAEEFDAFWKVLGHDPDARVCSRCSYGQVCPSSLVCQDLGEHHRQDRDNEK